MLETADIHCHMLGGVDDGAKDIDEMKQMIDIAYADGTRHICFTPHFKIYHFRNEDGIKAYNEQIDKSFASAKEYASEKYPDLNLYLGNEVMYHSDVIDSADSYHCRRLNDSSYFLVEFQPNVSIYDMRNGITKILRKGYIPVVAHVERYLELLEKPNFAWELKQYGALLQVNASSVERMRIGKTAKFLKFLFKKSYVDVVASDSHNHNTYKPGLSKAVARITKLYGENVAKKVCLTTPLAILNNNKLF